MSKPVAIALIALCQVAAMALWFSASAVVPALLAQYNLSSFAQAALTSGVQLGFVTGSLTSAIFGLSDRLEPRRFFMSAALIGAATNALILVVDPSGPLLPLLRFITGICMAGIYPVGMKLASTWARGDMGLMVGLLVGALTLGSATPHLFNALGGIDWRFTIALASMSALVAAVLINFTRVGPNTVPPRRFDRHAMFAAWRVRSLRLANFGYLGHMWELYAMWAWIGVFLQSSFAMTMPAETASSAAKLATFATIGIGAIGCVAGGVFADRLGRTTLTMIAMSISGACAATIGFLYGGNAWVLIAVALLWGLTIVADSAQFSASIAELSDRAYVGTMLTVQTAAGFTLTLVTIHLMPVFVEYLGWTCAFMPLAIGPLLGVIAMSRLRADPDSVKLAGGRR